MKTVFKMALCVALGVISKVGCARVVYYGTETESVTIPYGAPTLFRFPGEVKTISQAQRYKIEPADSEQPSFSLLSVTPRFTTGSSNVAFFLSDGTIVKTKLTTVSQGSPEKTDSVYDFRSKETLVNPDAEKVGSSLSELELMKAMIRGDEVSGYEVRNLVRTISPGFKGVSTRLVKLYTGSQFNGYVFEIENTSRKERLYLNIQNLTLGEPNVALLSSVDTPLIDPAGIGGKKAYLKIVAKASSMYNQLVLPVQAVERKDSHE